MRRRRSAFREVQSSNARRGVSSLEIEGAAGCVTSCAMHVVLVNQKIKDGQRRCSLGNTPALFLVKNDFAVVSVLESSTYATPPYCVQRSAVSERSTQSLVSRNRGRCRCVTDCAMHVVSSSQKIKDAQRRCPLGLRRYSP